MLINPNLFANPLLDSLHRANDLYIDGHYEQAISLYQLIIADGYESGDLYYNLGNAYYKTHNVPLSIYYYEKALLLAPGDEQIKHNMELVKALVVDNIEPIPEPVFKTWFKNIRSMFSLDTWSYISLGAFILFLLLILVYLFTRMIKNKKFAFWFATLFFVLFISSFGFARKQKSQIQGGNYAIIYTPSIHVKSEPNESSTSLFILHEGAKVEIIGIGNQGEWKEILLADGNRGYVRLNDLLIL